MPKFSTKSALVILLGLSRFVSKTPVAVPAKAMRPIHIHADPLQKNRVYSICSYHEEWSFVRKLVVEHEFLWYTRNAANAA